MARRVWLGRCVEERSDRRRTRTMKRRDKRRPHKPTIWVVSEDRAGAYVIQAILHAKNINANVEPRQTGNLTALAKQLDRILDAVLHQMRADDCIIVLHDTDDSTQANRKWYKQIGEICGR